MRDFSFGIDEKLGNSLKYKFCRICFWLHSVQTKFCGIYHYEYAIGYNFEAFVFVKLSCFFTDFLFEKLASQTLHIFDFAFS